MCSKKWLCGALLLLFSSFASGEDGPTFSDEVEAALTPVLDGELTPDQLDGLTAVFLLYERELATLKEEQAGLSTSLQTERRGADLERFCYRLALGALIAVAVAEGLALAFK